MIPTAPAWLALALAVAVGACLGSFAALVAQRLPRGESWAAGRSRCRSCRTPLRARDLVPVLSWLATRGRCRHCGAAVSVRHPLVEALTGLLVAAAWGLHGPGWAALCLAGLVTALMIAVLVDLDHLILPDETLVAAVLLGLGWRAATDQAWLTAAATAATLAAVGLLLRWAFTRLRGVEALGLGDIKLMAVAGLWLPPAAVSWFLATAGGFGLLTALVLGTLGARPARGESPALPFGPGLAAGLYLVLLAQPPASG